MRTTIRALGAGTLLTTVCAGELSARDNPNMETITVYGKQNRVVTESMLATKSSMSLMQTPAPLVVVDEALIIEQAATDLQDLVGVISGVTQAGNNYGIGDTLVIRGLGANYTYDGMYGGAGLGNTFNPTRSLTNVQSVEVLKGPASVLYGIGSAGGIVNLIEKKPDFERFTEFEAEAGSWNAHSLQMDHSGIVNDGLAYRVVAKTARSDGYRDIGLDRDEVYSSLRFRLSDAQTLVASLAWIDDSVQVDSTGHPIRIYSAESAGGIPASQVSADDLINDPAGTGIQLTDTQREQLAGAIESGDGLQPYDNGGTSLASPLSRPNEGGEVRFKLHYNIHFNDDLSLSQQLQYRDYDSEFVRQTGAYNYLYWNRNGTINADPRAPLVIDGVLYPYAARRQEYRKVVANEKSWQYFADLRYQFETLGFRQEMLLTANLEDRDIDEKSWSAYDPDGGGSVPYILDIRNPDWAGGRFEDYDPTLRSNFRKVVEAWGIGLQHVGYLGDHWTTRIGVAFNQIDQAYEHLGTDSGGATPEQDSSDSGMTYNLGVSYLPTESLAIFANVAQGRTAYSILGSVSGTDDDRPDSESESYDLGLRVRLLDDQLLGSLVVFRTARANLRYGNPDYNDNPDDPEYNVSVRQYYYDGEERTEGVELDLNAQLSAAWYLHLNATYQEARDRMDPYSSGFDQRMKGMPLVSAGSWLTYTTGLTSWNAQLKASVGANYVDERSAGSSAFGVPDGYVPSYTVWNAALSIETERWRAQLNLDNLLDETYYSKAMFLGGMPGAERNAMLTLSYRF